MAWNRETSLPVTTMNGCAPFGPNERDRLQKFDLVLQPTLERAPLCPAPTRLASPRVSGLSLQVGRVEAERDPDP